MMKKWCHFVVSVLAAAVLSGPVLGQEWHTEPFSPIDRQYIAEQREAINALARSHLGRQLNGQKDNDLEILQRLLDEDVVHRNQVRLLQGMGLILGQLLKQEQDLNWIIYYDKLGRSRALQVPGFTQDFIFPATQISRLAEVGIKVDVRDVYRSLEQAVEAIRKKPRL